MVAEASGNSDVGVESSSRADTNRAIENGIHCRVNGSRSFDESMGFRIGAVRTYKRRKCGASSSESKLAQLEKLFDQPQDKMLEEVLDAGLEKRYHEQVCCPKRNCNSLLNCSDDFSYQHWKSKLQNLSESFSSDQGGMSGIDICIRDALSSFQQIEASMGNGDAHYVQRHTNQDSDPKRSSNVAERHAVVASNESSTSSSKLYDFTVTTQCQSALLRTIMSEKFKYLYKLLSENFNGVNFDKFLNFNLLNLRMKEGAYEQDPALFASDVQELWRKVLVAGTEMMSLSKSLSDLTRLFCREIVKEGGKEHGTIENGKKEVFPWVFEWADRREKPTDSLLAAVTCRQCSKKSDNRDCLVCDSCEEMFHVSCIKPDVTEVPQCNWYCANCTALGTGCHENCVVCERLNLTTGAHDVEDEKIRDELEDSSCYIVESGSQVYKGGNRVCCKVCKSMLERGELFRFCEHNACDHYYHVRCLSNKQLKSYCSRWYCPCCLCRVCLADKDDDKIVLCDACDNAYHIYCMSPQQSSIPEGQWFCRKCEAGIQAVLGAKLAYNKTVEENLQKKVEDRKKVRNSMGKKPTKVVGKVDRSVGVEMLLSAANSLGKKPTKVVGKEDGSGGVEMLLSAANAISHQEQLAALNNSI